MGRDQRGKSGSKGIELGRDNEQRASDKARAEETPNRRGGAKAMADATRANFNHETSRLLSPTRENGANGVVPFMARVFIEPLRVRGERQLDRPRFRVNGRIVDSRCVEKGVRVNAGQAFYNVQLFAEAIG